MQLGFFWWLGICVFFLVLDEVDQRMKCGYDFLVVSGIMGCKEFIECVLDEVIVFGVAITRLAGHLAESRPALGLEKGESIHRGDSLLWILPVMPRILTVFVLYPVHLVGVRIFQCLLSLNALMNRLLVKVFLFLDVFGGSWLQCDLRRL